MNQDASSPPPTAAPVEGAGGNNGRIVFDITTTALWSGPPFGIVRVEREFARWGLGHVDAFTPAIFDPQARTFRHVSRDMARRLISQDAAIDTLSLVNPARVGKRKTGRIPQALRPAALWVLQSRRKTLAALERVRIGTTDTRIAAFADRLGRALMNAKHRAAMIKPDRSRRDSLPLDMVAGAAIDFTAHDTLICCGSTWTHVDIGAIAEQKGQRGFRFVLSCFDLIALMFPHFYPAGTVAAHAEFWRRAFPVADLVMFISRTVEADVRAYCGAHGLVLGHTAVCPLGANIDIPAAGAGGAAVPLPAGLEPGRYALLVGTIEPRKGHRMIYEVWLRLLADNVPQRARFKMVFAGREGWMTGDLMRTLRGDARTGETLKMLTEVDEALMATLYANAAFCLLPSRYEGFGLPAIEAFHHGKAVLASTGGAVPEAVGDFSPCLDPDDAEAWQRMLRSWIEEPAARAVYEERIRTSFRHPSWDQSAQAFFALVRNAPRPALSG
jgi:glycosyltransferase involved in cell wall biosynthesis